MWTLEYSLKWAGLLVSVQNLLDNADTGMPLRQDCPPSLINSMTGHYDSTSTHSTSFLLAFLTSVQQGLAWECIFVALNGTSMDCHTYMEIYWKPLK